MPTPTDTRTSDVEMIAFVEIDGVAVSLFQNADGIQLAVSGSKEYTKDIPLTSFREKIEAKEREQADYNLSMAIQAIDFYISKDAEEYGETALHNKLHAYISSNKWGKALTPPKETNK